MKNPHRGRLQTLLEQSFANVPSIGVLDTVESKLLMTMVHRSPELVKGSLMAQGKTPEQADFIVRNISLIVKLDEEKRSKIEEEIVEIEELLEWLF